MQSQPHLASDAPLDGSRPIQLNSYLSPGGRCLTTSNAIALATPSQVAPFASDPPNPCHTCSPPPTIFPRWYTNVYSLTDALPSNLLRGNEIDVVVYSEWRDSTITTEDRRRCRSSNTYVRIWSQELRGSADKTTIRTSSNITNI